ncbi:cytochrome P450 [Bombardia bombarda]|uniref:Cytochrome P450 n=1 Tax=Bombardia bombarda TaxID=252184 RepID=A0AA40BW16_9PEZI|nr:cytochrome P450 [Bombardia bombarda]
MTVADILSSSPYAHLVVAISLIVTVYALYGAVWRLYLSPISHVPGPKLAALTWWYEFYYDIILGGQYTFKIIELHRTYGPIIRINPYEIHIGDPEFHSELYPTSNRRRDKWRFYTKQFGADESSICTTDHEHHKARRAALNPFFSLQTVRALQPVVEERVDTLMARLHEYGKNPGTQPLDMMYPFSAFTYDVINEYSFARSYHLLEKPDFGKEVTDSLLTGTFYGKWIQHVGIIIKLINALPETISVRVAPALRGFFKLKNDILHQIAEIQATSNTDKWELDVSHPTLFHELLSSKILPPAEKTAQRLSHEGQIIVQGGTLTTSWALTLATFHLLDRPITLRLLRDELIAKIPDSNAPMPVAELQQFPYLNAVVKEVLRHAIGTSGRLTRVCPDETLTYTNPDTDITTAIPPGVPVSMTTYKTITDPDLFPHPHEFRPERWLAPGTQEEQEQEDHEQEQEQEPEQESEQQRLERFLTIFGGGSRICLGMPLAMAELFIVIAKMWRVWGAPDDQRKGDVGVVRVYETTTRDAMMVADWFVPMPARESEGIRVTFESK